MSKFKLLPLLLMFLIPACGGLENSVEVIADSVTVEVQESGAQIITLKTSCTEGGFFGSDECEGANICVAAQWQKSETDATAMGTAKTCRTFESAGDVAYTITSTEMISEEATAIKLTTSITNNDTLYSLDDELIIKVPTKQQ